MEPTDLIKVADVPSLVEQLTGVKRSRQTVYQWISHGVRGSKLETVTLAGQLFCSIAAVESFVATLGRGRR